MLLLLGFNLPISKGGAVGIVQDNISLYWGKTYRFGDKTYNTFEIANEQFYHTCLMNRFYGYGIRLDDFKNNNFSLSVKYFHKLIGTTRLCCNPYWAVSPVVFRFNNNIGINLKPEIGIRFNFREYYLTKGWLSLCINVSYAYDVPILNKNYFNVNRSDLSIKAALSINIFHCLYKRYLKKKDDKIEKSN